MDGLNPANPKRTMPLCFRNSLEVSAKLNLASEPLLCVLGRNPNSQFLSGLGTSMTVHSCISPQFVGWHSWLWGLWLSMMSDLTRGHYWCCRWDARLFRVAMRQTPTKKGSRSGDGGMARISSVDRLIIMAGRSRNTKHHNHSGDHKPADDLAGGQT
ncbi:hypothetical protein DL546_006245 [Coniochaeta pulveracea]|uniref:Uncharacterized protein n=1 Tax=Coniochaeta pulveracea TaxID=177199 RepID=A0A420YJJ0_9PEZI|nr:hypothetical protein DL546_006245 [Coniochaeta pulveracea]